MYITIVLQKDKTMLKIPMPFEGLKG